jgi:hypothetical protein
MLRRYLWAASILLLAVSCDSEKNTGSYWDSKAYFESEITRLTKEHAGLQKNLLFDKQHNSIQNDTPDWKKELEPFLAIDLNKAAYAGRFDVDTSLGYTGFRIRFKAKDAQTDLRYCIITKQTDQLYSVEAAFGNKNNLYQSTKKFTYNPHLGYSITGDQRVTLSTPVDYTIEANFVKP